MNTAEQLAFALREEPRGIHSLLWADQGDLVRALLLLLAALPDSAARPILVSPEADCWRNLRQLIAARCPLEAEQAPQEDASPAPRDSRLWGLFLQQASTRTVGPWLNGWRRPLSEPPGSLLVVRHADFLGLQREAPDLASYIGPRVVNASAMLSLCSDGTRTRLQPRLPGDFQEVLRELPGEPPPQTEITAWIAALDRIDALPRD